MVRNWQGSQLEIRLNAFCLSTIPKNNPSFQFNLGENPTVERMHLHLYFFPLSSGASTNQYFFPFTRNKIANNYRNVEWMSENSKKNAPGRFPWRPVILQKMNITTGVFLAIFRSFQNIKFLRIPLGGCFSNRFSSSVSWKITIST